MKFGNLVTKNNQKPSYENGMKSSVVATLMTDCLYLYVSIFFIIDNLRDAFNIIPLWLVVSRVSISQTHPLQLI